MNVRIDYPRDQSAPVVADPAVPSVLEILDEGRLLEELARAFPERSFSEPTRVMDVRYVPRRTLAAAFEVAEEGQPQVIAVRADASGLPGGDPGPRPEGIRVLGGWVATAWRYPADPRLRALTRLADPAAMTGVARWLLGEDLPVTDCMPLRYVPEERCVIRAVGPDLDIVARNCTPGDGEIGHGRLRWLWDHPDRSFRMAKPLGFDDRMQTRFERTVPGRRSDAASILGRSIPLRPLCDELGSLHVLDGAQLTPALRRLGPGTLLGRVERTAARRLALAFPGLTPAVSACIQALRANAAELGSSREVTLHGDLHAGNLILDGQGPALVGLDSLALGDPAFDLALLGSSLFLAALARGASVTRVGATIEELPWVYSQVTGTAVSPDSYAWHLAAALVGWQADAALQALVPHADDVASTLVHTAISVLRDGASAASMTSFAD